MRYIQTYLKAVQSFEAYVKLIPSKLFFRFFFRSSRIETYVK